MLLAALTIVLMAAAPQHPGMHFDQDAVQHHFRLEPTGGAIEIQVKPGTAPATLETVRKHLQEIAVAFKRGDFSSPMVTHGEVPAGVAQMTELKDRIRYTYAEIPAGGRVTIRTTDKPALDAVHAFLRYQIKEHKTGDPIRLQ